jgi:predicted 2-oxoglutarate/Fe(II)-dependent dioxygenase YbiX
MIEQLTNLFDENYINFLLNEIKNKNFETIGQKVNSIEYNYYNRYHLEIDDTSKENIESFLYKKYNKKYVLKNKGIWINKITPETNKDDTFHTDTSDLTIVTYLNDDYTGGEFEYINKSNKPIKIETQLGLSLIMDSILMHRVSPVLSGNRYSLVCFFDMITKNEKTII